MYKNAVKNKLLAAPNQAWLSDITYLRINNGFVYLFLITDAYSRKITGWSLSDSLSIEGAINALKMAIKQCRQTNGIIHHSDRGIQYCSNAYTGLLKKCDMTIRYDRRKSLLRKCNGRTSEWYFKTRVYA